MLIFNDILHAMSNRATESNEYEQYDSGGKLILE